MVFFMKRVLPLILLLVLACLSLGQGRPGFGMAQPNIMNVGAGYLMIPSVQKELALSPATSKKIQDKMMTATRTMMPPPSSAGKTQDQKTQMADFSKRMAAIQKVQGECVAMLTPAQKTRLKQITIQQMGASAMFNADIKKELGLNETQTKQISNFMQAAYKDMFSRPNLKPGQRPTQQEQMKMMQDMAKKQEIAKTKINGQTMKVLTPTQQSKWKAMQGKPFKLDMMGMMRSAPGSTRRVN